MNDKTVNTAVIKARIEEVHPYEGRYYHRCTLPAADQFSKPGACTVESTQNLGHVGSEINISAKIAGFARPFTRKDGTRGYDVKTHFIHVPN